MSASIKMREKGYISMMLENTEKGNTDFVILMYLYYGFPPDPSSPSATISDIPFSVVTKFDRVSRFAVGVRIYCNDFLPGNC
jgi:hypothetical protein